MLGMQSNEAPDALDLLKKDHETVEDLFDQFEDAKESENEEEMASLAASICTTTRRTFLFSKSKASNVGRFTERPSNRQFSIRSITACMALLTT